MSGQCLAISEKIDSLIGIFSIGKAPTGDKDPFALRRSAIGLLRIIIECEIDIDLKDLLSTAASTFSNKNQSLNCINDVYTFLMERLRHYYRDEGFNADVFESVFGNVSAAIKSNISENLAAEKSSWEGLATLINGFDSIPNSLDFDHAFSDFHRRLSTNLAQNADFQAKLTQAFDRFKILRDN